VHTTQKNTLSSTTSKDEILGGLPLGARPCPGEGRAGSGGVGGTGQHRPCAKEKGVARKKKKFVCLRVWKEKRLSALQLQQAEEKRSDAEFEPKSSPLAEKTPGAPGGKKLQKVFCGKSAGDRGKQACYRLPESPGMGLPSKGPLYARKKPRGGKNKLKEEEKRAIMLEGEEVFPSENKGGGSGHALRTR